MEEIHVRSWETFRFFFFWYRCFCCARCQTTLCRGCAASVRIACQAFNVQRSTLKKVRLASRQCGSLESASSVQSGSSHLCVVRSHAGAAIHYQLLQLPATPSLPTLGSSGLSLPCVSPVPSAKKLHL